MKKKNFSQNVLEKIKDGLIKPKPKWIFVLKNILLWLFGILSLIFGALAMAVIIYSLNVSDWSLYWRGQGSILKFITFTLPYFWLLFLAVFIFIFYWNFKNTRYGYRYKIVSVVLGSVLLSIVLGGIFFKAGIGKAMDDTFIKKVPIYRRILEQREKPWLLPEKGVLSGRVKEVSEKEIELEDLKGNKWKINTEKLKEKIELKQDKCLRMIGKKKNKNNFDAKVIKQCPFGKIFPMNKGSKKNFERKLGKMRSNS